MTEFQEHGVIICHPDRSCRAFINTEKGYGILAPRAYKKRECIAEVEGYAISFPTGHVHQTRAVHKLAEAMLTFDIYTEYASNAADVPIFDPALVERSEDFSIAQWQHALCRVYTNKFDYYMGEYNACDLSWSRDSCWLFPYMITSMNHSCEPNVRMTIDKEKATATIYANQSIQAGEELMCEYQGTMKRKSVEIRRAFYKHVFGFWCMCTKCQREGVSL